MVGRRYRATLGGVLFDLAVHLGIVSAMVVTLYPFVYVLSMSLSSPDAVLRNEVLLLPRGLYLGAYRLIVANPEVWRAYYNTVWYTGVGTALNIAFTMAAAYPLSRRQYSLRKPIMLLFLFTMFFSGGMIPSFLLVLKLGLLNTRWAMVLPGLITTWNLIICRTYLQHSIAEELLEAAHVEGASEFRVLLSIVVPLSTSIIATLVIFYAVGHWNAFFNALIYLQEPRLQPLQLYLRRILFSLDLNIAANLRQALNIGGAETIMMYLQIKYAVIIVTILPILLVYPFAQRYFVRGVMIGSLKG